RRGGTHPPPRCLGDTSRPQPAPPTLFPYTTLFRSTAAGPAPSESLVFQPSRPNRNPVMPTSEPRRVSLTFSTRSTLTHRPEQELDRKSTRRNSSHVAISYAVFCLKKKLT